MKICEEERYKSGASMISGNVFAEKETYVWKSMQIKRLKNICAEGDAYSYDHRTVPAG